ncbi:hypothetical protein GUJ93_ZPchr0001g29337 [Zizania palustris]|uniref:Uncharacterized protein n=1 Tax=Zizania palustris TaxID=103762 RepID=A0A8J5RV37_ZIZPA|nr:hypothetical protein GUJ93_ZPchr0001g29337 [Zizania palustris]
MLESQSYTRRRHARARQVAKPAEEGRKEIKGEGKQGKNRAGARENKARIELGRVVSRTQILELLPEWSGLRMLISLEQLTRHTESPHAHNHWRPRPCARVTRGTRAEMLPRFASPRLSPPFG